MGISSSFKNQACEEAYYIHTRTCLPMEEHAQHILTQFAFNVLQHELVLAMQYAISETPNKSYIASHFKNMDGERLVIWIPEDEQIHCSCKQFESSGILCRHSLRVLLLHNYFQIPEKYFPSRWRRQSSLVPCDDQGNQNGNDVWFQEFHSLTGTLFSESSVTKERSDYVRRELTKELTRLINEVRDIPASNGVAMNLALSPTG